LATLRLFAAACLPPEMEMSFKAILEKASAKGAGVKWVPDSQLHLTLLFMGEQEEDRIPRLIELFGEAASSFASFSMELGGVGAFPDLNRPRALFVPAARGLEPFRKLSEALREKAESVGFVLEKKEIHPHVTLGRAREGKNVKEVVRLLRETCPASLGILSVNRFYIFKSELTSTGAFYTRLREFQLKDEADL
jgi:RNA 2',3'-cyclic 3'-phosphodiesterase